MGVILESHEFKIFDSNQNHQKEPIEKLIVNRIYRAVIEQRLAPNTKLSESKLCQTFGVGRMHVRRALLLLSSQGIINLQSNRGAFVASPDQKEANEVFEARLMIEPRLIRKLTGNISKSQMNDLYDHIQQENNARDRSERIHLIRLSGEFHVKLAEASGNSIITNVVKELVTKTSLIVGMFGASSHSSCPDDEHKKLLDAISDNDSEKAHELIINHLNHIWSELDISSNNKKSETLESILGGVL